MNKSPKKIWVDVLERDIATWEWEGGTPYIREDLVDALVETLVETLKGIVRYAGNNGDDYLADQIRAALENLEGSHD